MLLDLDDIFVKWNATILLIQK